MNIELPDTITVQLGRNGKYGSRDVPVASFTADIHRYAYEYGLRQIVNDAMADKTDDEGNALPPDQIVAKADKRIDALRNGTIRQRAGGSAEPLDPVEAEAWKIAKTEIAAMVKKIAAPKEAKGDVALLFRVNTTTTRETFYDSIAEVITAYLAGPKGADVMRRAKRNVAERAKAVDMAEAGI